MPTPSCSVQRPESALKPWLAAAGPSEESPAVDAGEVYRRLSPAVLGYLRGQGVLDPEDLLGEVFYQVTRSLPKFEGTDAQLRRWVFTIARNRVIDDRRKRRRRPFTTSIDGVDQSDGGMSETANEDLIRALAMLTHDQREVVALRFIADLSLESVAEMTERSTGAVKSMQHRALEQLARSLRTTDEQGRTDG